MSNNQDESKPPETKKKRAIRILLADDHNIMREGLRALLQSENDMAVVAEVDNGRDAVKKTLKLEPDVAIMDIGMPDLNGVDATRQILRENANTRVLCLSVHQERGLVQAMLEAGGSGYLLKTTVSEELITAIRAIVAGGTYLSPHIAGIVVEHNVRGKGRNSERNAYNTLTAREREVLQLIAEGNDSRDVGRQLCISSKTVLAHRERIMEKVGTCSTAGLIRYALRQGIADL